MSDIKSIKEIDKEPGSKILKNETELGALLWELESLEKFYPCYKTMLKNEGK